MKALKITLLLVAVILLAMSGISNDKIEQDATDNVDQTNTELNLITHNRAGTDIPGNS